MAEENNGFQHFYLQSPQLSPWKAFRVFLWNSEKSEFLGRTGLNWAKITVFYLLFYAALAALCAVFFSLFFLTINYSSPKWQLDGSLIGTNPGLGFRPMMLLNSSNPDSTLIWYNQLNRTTFDPWVNSLLEFTEEYYAPRKFATGTGKIKSCSHTQYPTDDEVCDVDVRDWGPCNRYDMFNYNRSSPCIFIKLNKIYGWTPDYYTIYPELPPDMPQQLKDHIRNMNSLYRKNVWVSCQGESPADKEFIGTVKYYPKDIHGFPGYYFPYLNKESYLSPLVAVRFENPKPGVLINIECRAWAKNLKYNRADRMASVHLELLVDNLNM